MSITQEQIEYFKRFPFPQGVSRNLSFEGKIHRGNEALVIKFQDKAFKWYAKQSELSFAEKVAYGDGINQDEKKLRQVGLDAEQLPDSHFFISKYFKDAPELFAIQPWIEGPLLRDVPIRQILENSALRQSLASLFLISHQFYQQTSKFPDLKGSEKFFGITDPTKIIWPFRSTNIIIADDKAVLTDARALNPAPGSVKFQISKLHQAITLIAARTILKTN